MGFKCIHNGTVVTMNANRDIIEDGAVVIENDKIVDIGEKQILENYVFETSLDAKGGIIMPGFINGHTHISMSVFRTLGEDVPDRLYKYLFPLEDALVDENLVSVGARLSMAEMIMGGVTTFVDMYYYEQEVARSAEAMGMRAVVGQTVIDRKAPDAKNGFDGIQRGIKLIENWKNHSLITPAFAPHASYSNEEEHLKEIRQLAEKYGVPIMMHIAEMPFETERFQAKYGLSPVAYLDSIGFLNENVIGAHLIYVDSKDMNLLLRNNVGVIHNVAANAKSGRRVSPAPQMLAMGIPVGLGTDGPMSGNTLDVIGLMHQYTKIQKSTALDNRLCPAKQAVEMGTITGAKAIHMDKSIGSLEKDKKADLIVIDTQTPNIQPIYDVYAALVYGASSHDVVMSVINGKVVMKDRILLTESMESIFSDVNQIKMKIQTAARAL